MSVKKDPTSLVMTTLRLPEGTVHQIDKISRSQSNKIGFRVSRSAMMRKWIEEGIKRDGAA